MRLLLAVIALAIGFGLGFWAGRSLGFSLGVIAQFEWRYEEERKWVAPVLAADPAFERIITVNFPVLGICVGGPVKTQDDYDRLRAEMIRVLGEPRINHVMNDVYVEQAAGPGER